MAQFTPAQFTPAQFTPAQFTPAQFTPDGLRRGCWWFAMGLLLSVTVQPPVLAQPSEPLTELAGHPLAINSAIYSPDGTLIATASSDQLIKLWDAKTGQPVRTLQGHQAQVLSLAMHPDSQLLVSGAADNTIKIWDLPRTGPLHRFEGHPEKVSDSVTGPSGCTAITAGIDGTLRLWDLETREILAIWSGHDQPVHRVAYRNDGNEVASGDATGNVLLWNVLTGEPLAVLGADNSPITGLVYHPNNQQLVSLAESGQLKLWQLPIKSPTIVSKYEQPVSAVQLTAGGQQTLIAAGTQLEVRNAANGELIRPLESPPSDNQSDTDAATSRWTSLASRADSTLAAAAAEDGSIVLWTLANGTVLGQLRGHEGAVHDIHFDVAGNRMVTAGEDATVRVWSLPGPEVALAGHPGSVYAAHTSSNGQLSATVGTDGIIRLFTPTTGALARQIPGHTVATGAVRFRSDAAQLASGDEAGNLRLVNPADGNLQGLVGAHEGAVLGIAYPQPGSPEASAEASASELLATSGTDGTLKRWQLPLAAEQTFVGHTAAVTAVAMAHDGSVVVTGGSDQSVRAFDGEAATPLRQFAGPAVAVTALALSDDHSLTARGAVDGTIRLWHTADGKPWQGKPDIQLDETNPDAPAETMLLPATAELHGHQAAVVDLAFDSSGQRIASASADGSVRIWQLPEGPQVMNEAGEPLTALAVSPDRRLSATATSVEGKPAVLIRDLRTGKVTQTLLGHRGTIQSVAFNHDGTMLATASADQTAQVWNLQDPKFPRRQRFKHPSAVQAVGFDAMSKQLFTAANDHIIRGWLLESGADLADAASADQPAMEAEPAVTFTGHSNTVGWLITHETTLFSASADGTLRLWDLQKGVLSRSINHGGAITALDISSNGKIAVTGGADNALKIWQTADGAAVATLNGHSDAPNSVAISADSSHLCSSSPTSIRFWDIPQQALLETVPLTDWKPAAIFFAASSLEQQEEATIQSLAHREMIVAGSQGSIRKYRPQIVRYFPAHTEGAAGVAFIPSSDNDGDVSSASQWLATAGADGRVLLWNETAGKPLVQLAGPTGAVSSLTVATTARRVAAGGADQKLYVWDIPALNATTLAAAAELQTVEAKYSLEQPAEIRDIQFDSQGKRLAVSDVEGATRVWDVDRQRVLQRFATHQGPVHAVAFSQDGHKVLSGGEDQTVRANRVAASIIAVAPEGVYHDLTFDAANQKLFAASDKGELSVWPIDADGFGEATALPAADQLPDPWQAIPQRRLALHPELPRLAALDRDGNVRIWDLDTGKLETTIEAFEPVTQTEQPTTEPTEESTTPYPQRQSCALCFNLDGSRLFVASNNRIRCYDTGSNLLLEELAQPSSVFAISAADQPGRIVVGRSATAAAASTTVAAIDQMALQTWLQGHQGPVLGAVFTPDGEAVISGGEDQSIRFWDLQSQQATRRYVGATDSITSVGISPDGNHVLASSLDGTVRVWPIAAPDAAQAADGSSESAPDAAATDSTIPHSAVASIEARLTLDHPEPVGQCVASSNSELVVTAADDGVIRVFDLEQGRMLQRFEGHAESARAISIGANNTTILSGSIDGAVQQAQITLVRHWQAHEANASGLALLNGGAQAATSGDATHVSIWNLADGQPVRQFEHEQTLTAFSVRPDNSQLVTADEQANVHIWNLADGTKLTRFQVPAAVAELQHSADNQKFVAAMSDGGLRFYSGEDGSLLYELSAELPLSTATFTQDGRQVLTGSETGIVHLWGYASPEAVRTLTGHGGSVYSVAVNGDGTRIASASADQTVRLWNLESGAQLSQLSGHVGPAYGVDFSSDGALLVSAGADGSVRLWDVLGGRQLKQIAASSQAQYTAVFHPDGKRVAAAGLDKNIRLYDVTSGNLLSTFEGHQDYVYRTQFNENGSRLLSAGYGGHMIVWDVASGKILFQESLDRVANAARYAPTFDQFIVAGGDGKALIIEVPATAQ